METNVKNKKRIKQNKIVKAGLGYTIGNYFLKGLSFFTIPLFTRLLTTQDYGKYNTFLSYENILFVLLGFAIHSSYKNARYKFGVDQEDKNNYYSYSSASILLIIVSASGWLLCVNVFCKQLSAWLQMDVLCLNFLVCYAFGNAVITCFNSDAGIEYKYQDFLKISGANAILNIILSIVLIVVEFPDEKYVGRIAGSTIAITLVAIYVVRKFFQRSKPKNNVNFWKWGLKYSIPIIPHGLSQIVLGQFDRIMIMNMVSGSMAGIYSFAYNIYAIVQVTANSLDSVWGPWFYEKRKNEDLDSIKRYSSYYAFFMFLFSSLIIFLSPEIVKFLARKDYWEAVYSVIPIIAGGYFAFLYTIPSNVEYYHGKTKYIAIGTMLAAVINIILNYIFINKCGYIAAAYTTLVTYFLYFVFHYILARKIEGIFLFSNKMLFKCSIGMLVIVWIGNVLIDSLPIRMLIVLLILAISFCYEEKNIGILKRRK